MKPMKNEAKKLSGTITDWSVELSHDPKTIRKALRDAGESYKPRDEILARVIFAALAGAGKKARERLTLAQAQREELKLQNDRRELISWTEAHAQAREAAAFFFGELDRAERELPPAIKGLDEIEAMQALKAFFKSVRENARKRFDTIPGRAANA